MHFDTASLPSVATCRGATTTSRAFATLTERYIRRGTHRSTRQLEDAIKHYVKVNNDDPKPFVWCKTADDICLIVFGLVAVTGIGLSRSASILAEGRIRQQAAFELALLATQWKALVEINGVRNQAALMSSDPAVAMTFKGAIDATSADISALEKRLEALPQTDAGRQLLKKITEVKQQAVDAHKEAAAAKTEGKVDESMALANGKVLTAGTQYVAALDELVKMQERQTAEAQAETERRRVANLNIILGGLAVIIALIVALTFAVVRSIRDPLQAADQLAARIARGDLSAEVCTTREDEFGSLLRSLGVMNNSLGTMVRWRRCISPMTWPVAMSSAANKVVVSWRS